MKKRILALGLSALLLAGVLPTGALAAGGTTGTVPAATLRHGYEAAKADAPGTLSFENLEARMRAGSPALRSAQATLDAQLAFDRKYEYDKLLKLINDTVDGAIALSGGNLTLASSMTAGLSSARDQLDMISEENWGELIESLDRQINQVISQLIMGAESLYFNIRSTENAQKNLARTVKALERSGEEMRIRYEYGQISALALSQFESGLTAAKSQEESLRLAISNMKAALQSLLGEPMTGELTLAPLPAVSGGERQLEDLGFDQALALARERSFTLYDGKKKLEDAEEEWKDAKRAHGYNTSRYKTAEQTYLSAVYSYEATVKSFEHSMFNLRGAIDEKKAALQAAELDALYRAKEYEAQQLRHKLGQLSDTGLLSAENDYLAALEAEENAAAALLAAYHNYSWAVHYGIVP